PIGGADHRRCDDTRMLGGIERTGRHGGRNRAHGFGGGGVGHAALTCNPYSQSALLDFDLGKPGLVEKACKGAHHILGYHRIGFLLVVGRHRLTSVSLWTSPQGYPQPSTPRPPVSSAGALLRQIGRPSNSCCAHS